MKITVCLIHLDSEEVLVLENYRWVNMPDKVFTVFENEESGDRYYINTDKIVYMDYTERGIGE